MGLPTLRYIVGYWKATHSQITIFLIYSLLLFLLKSMHCKNKIQKVQSSYPVKME